MKKRWAIIKKFPHYAVSNYGGVRRIVACTGARTAGKFLKPYQGKYGHCTVDLYKNKKSRHKFVHTLVLEAFKGPCPKGHQGAHWDGNASNNKINNLRWATPSSNNQDKFRHGTHPLGITHPFSKLKDSDVLAIRKLRKEGKLLSELKTRFKVSEGYISEICRYKQRLHLP